MSKKDKRKSKQLKQVIDHYETLYNELFDDVIAWQDVATSLATEFTFLRYEIQKLDNEEKERGKDGS